MSDDGRIFPDRIVQVNADADGFFVASSTAWEVETPTGFELAPLGWDEEDTAVMERSELSALLDREQSPLVASCLVVLRKHSRPSLDLDLDVA